MTAANRGALYMNLTRSGNLADAGKPPRRAPGFIFDVGAIAGIYSLAALAIQRDAVVHAFEPTPEIAARLRATAKLNGLDDLHSSG